MFATSIVVGVGGDLVVVDFCEANESQAARFAAVAEDSMDHSGVECRFLLLVGIGNPPTVDWNGVSIVANRSLIVVEPMGRPG